MLAQTTGAACAPATREPCTRVRGWLVACTNGVTTRAGAIGGTHAGDALTVAWRRHAAAIAAANCARVSAGDAPANPATTARAQPRKSCASAPTACASMRTGGTAAVVSTAAASMSMSTGCRDDATSAGDGEEEDIEEGSTRKDIEEGSTKRGTERRRGRWTKNPEANRGRPCTTCNVGDVRSAGSVTMRRTERSGAVRRHG